MYVHHPTQYTVDKFIVPDWWGDKIGLLGDYEFCYRAGPQRMKRLEVQANVYIYIVYMSNLTSVCTLCTMYRHFVYSLSLNLLINLEADDWIVMLQRAYSSMAQAPPPPPPGTGIFTLFQTHFFWQTFYFFPRTSLHSRTHCAGVIRKVSYEGLLETGIIFR